MSDVDLRELERRTRLVGDAHAWADLARARARWRWLAGLRRRRTG